MRVFVSSTFRDLRACRAVVHSTLRSLRLDDVTMEHFVAEHDRPLDVCLRKVRECDLYVGVFAWRYGYVPDGGDRSITELEYRAAVEAGKPCLVFLLHDDAPWPRSSVDRGAEADAIEALREELAVRHTARYFTTSAELGIAVATALHHHLTTTDDPAKRLDHISPEAVTAYYQRLQKEYGRLDLDALTPPEREEYLQILLESVFVEQYVREDRPPTKLPPEILQRLRTEGESDESDLPEGIDLNDLLAAQETYRAKPQRPVLEVVSGSDRHVVVLGDPGAGKSTLARFVALGLAGVDRRLAPLAGHLPLLIELRQYAAAREAGGCRTLLDFIDELANAQSLGVAKQHLEPYLQAGGQAVVVFDGLDEIFDPGRRDETTKEIAGFAGLYPGVRALVTSRVVGYSPRRFTDAGFAHHTLQDLDHRQIAEFLTSWYALALHDRPTEAAQRRDRLLEAVRDSRSIGELAGNPLLLTILAIIGKHQVLPRERWEVYNHAARVLVQHWDVNRRLREKRVAIDYIDEDDKRELLRRLAWRMQTKADGTTGNYVHRSDLQQLFEKYLIDKYGRDLAEAKIAATVIIDQFQHRNFILSRFGPNLYSFVHRTFLEFFCADEVVRRFQREQSISLDQVVELYVEHRADATWREVLRLIASVLADRHVERISSRLLDVDLPWPVEEFVVPPHGVAVAVQCLGERKSMRGLASVAQRALVKVVLLLEHCVGVDDSRATDLIRKDLLPTITSVGSAWPAREEVVDWYLRRGRWIIWAPVTELAATLLTVLFNDRVDVLLLPAHLAGNNDRRASSALFSVSDAMELGPTTPGSPDGSAREKSMKVLEPLTRRSNAGGRYWAIRALDLFHPGGPEVRELLLDRLRHDNNSDVVHLAATCLLRHTPGDPEVREALVHRIPQGLSVSMIRVILLLVTENDLNHPGLRPVLAVRAVVECGELFGDSDVNAVVRCVADEPQHRSAAVTTLRAIAESSYLHTDRYNALVVLDHVGPDDPDILQVLWDRLQRDHDDDVFRLVATCLLRRVPNDVDVLETMIRRVEDALSSMMGQAARHVAAAHNLEHPRLELAIFLSDVLDAGSSGDTGLFDDTAAVAALQRLSGELPDQDAVVAVLGDIATGSTGYEARHNALITLQHLAPEDPVVRELLWDRLRHDNDDDVFRLAATCLLRHDPDNPDIPGAMARRVERSPSPAFARAARLVIEEHELTGHPRLATVAAERARPDSDVLAKIAHNDIRIGDLPELEEYGPRDIPLSLTQWLPGPRRPGR
ncbi:DUF4062 domain-containing protein [Saccharothrix sp. Mg75]|uniref:DUF4062 domain-containing protein n=1 Tax=Saccharothrix sp. Mg75 TaxID=3445357 RepID=UPI003EEBA042